MPIYTYKCTCSEEFDRHLKISERDKPLSESCKSCGLTNIKRVVASPKIVSGVNQRQKLSGDWNNMLENIKKDNVGSTINV